MEAVGPKPHQGPSHPTIATVRPTRPREGSEPDTIAKRLIETLTVEKYNMAGKGRTRRRKPAQKQTLFCCETARNQGNTIAWILELREMFAASGLATIHFSKCLRTRVPPLIAVLLNAQWDGNTPW